MNNKRISPSNILAKECIVDALLKLIQDKSLSSISVSELCKKAGVSRMTFYRNYQSIEDIFVRHLSEIFDSYKADDAKAARSGIYCDREHIIHYFDYIYEYRNFLDGLIQCGFDVIFLNMLTTYICEKWEQQSDKYALTSFAGSLYNMFRLWSESQYSEDRNMLAEALVKIYS